MRVRVTMRYHTMSALSCKTRFDVLMLSLCAMPLPRGKDERKMRRRSAQDVEKECSKTRER